MAVCMGSRIGFILLPLLYAFTWDIMVPVYYTRKERGSKDRKNESDSSAQVFAFIAKAVTVTYESAG